MAAVGLLHLDPCHCSVASTSFSSKVHSENAKKLLGARRCAVTRLNSVFQDNKANASGGWQVRAVRSESLQSGTTPGVDDETEVLKRQQLFNKIAPMYDNKLAAVAVERLAELGSTSGVETNGCLLVRVCPRYYVMAKGGDSVLDICCGSGDLSFLLAQRVGRAGKVIGLDFAKEQLSVAAERERKSPRTTAATIEWIQGDALSLPFDDSSFDAITMGYGLRNVANIPQALAEIYRVLKPGKAASILDFNRSPDLLTNQVQGFMLDNVVVPVATYFGAQEEYAYLKTSVARFPLGSEQEQLATDQGFTKARHYELAGGLMGVLVVTK